MTTITIDGVEYPCRQTMAALVDFKEDTGKEAYEVSGLSDVAKLLYHQIRCSCEYEGKPFEMSFREFALRMSAEDVLRWADAVNAAAEEDGKKRRVASSDTSVAGIRHSGAGNVVGYVSSVKPCRYGGRV